MIIVVLFTLLLLAGILAATMRLGLGSRQNTADQAATLRAQYAAESGVSLARSTLRDIQTMLSPKGTSGGVIVDFMQLPASITQAMIETYAKKFCGKETASNPWISTSEFTTPRNPSDSQPYAEAEQCLVDGNSVLTMQKFSVLADAVTPAAYTILPLAERPNGSTSLTAWWNNKLDTVNLGNVRYAVKPLRVVKLNNSRYRFYLGLTSLSARNTSGSTARVLSGKRTSNGDWWFEVNLPDPFDYNLFINEWLDEDGGFYDDVIDGDMFVNQKIKFLFGTNQTKFWGNAFSAGCTAFPAATDATAGADCTKSPGFYSPLSTLVSPTDGSSVNALTSELNTRMADAGTWFAPGKKATFTSEYIPLPSNASDQKADAQLSGLLLDAQERNVELVAGDSSGNPLSSYNGITSAWDEPRPTYQYIRIRNPGNQLTGEYRYGSNKVLYKKTGGTWVSTGKTFNGVIYGGESPAQPITVSGPDRIGGSQTADVSKMPPALASFAEINMVGANGLRLDTDLTVSNTPCNNRDLQPGCPKTGNDRPKNILGLYAPSGNIVMTTNTKNEATYHAAIMASQGTFDVEGYNTRPVQGKRHVIGSVVEKRYGLNGVADATGGIVSGYGDDFSYDKRLKEGTLPPSSPISRSWKFSDNSVSGKRLDDLTWKQANAGDF